MIVWTVTTSVQRPSVKAGMPDCSIWQGANDTTLSYLETKHGTENCATSKRGPLSQPVIVSKLEINLKAIYYSDFIMQ